MRARDGKGPHGFFVTQCSECHFVRGKTGPTFPAQSGEGVRCHGCDSVSLAKTRETLTKQKVHRQNEHHASMLIVIQKFNNVSVIVDWTPANAGLTSAWMRVIASHIVHFQSILLLQLNGTVLDTSSSINSGSVFSLAI